MEAGATKKNKNVQKVSALAAAVIRDGKLQHPKLGEKRKFSIDTSPKTFRTVTHPKETSNRPSSTSICAISTDRLRAHGRGKGPLTPPPKPSLLIHDASFAVKQTLSIIKEKDIDDCDEYAIASTGESRLHDLTKAMVRLKTLELRCEDYEDQVVSIKKHLKGNSEVINKL